MKISEIRFTVTLDENHIPENIEWEADESGIKGKQPCKSVMLALWDRQSSDTLRIDLWTKDMFVDEMKIFYHKNLLAMADSFEKATGEASMAADMRDFCAHFAEKMFPKK